MSDNNLSIYTVLNMLGEPSRLRMVNLIYHGPLTVTEIYTALDLSQPNTSKHLKKLLDSEMILKYHKANEVYNYLNPEYSENCKILKPVLSTFSNHPDGKRDLGQLIQLVDQIMLEERMELIKSQGQ